MWVYLNNAFLSIVSHDREKDLLQVSSRFAGDIEHVFPEAEVSQSPEGDFRASLRRTRVSERIAQLTHDVNYHSFRRSIRDDDRRDTYMKVRNVMWDAQHRKDE